MLTLQDVKPGTPSKTKWGFCISMASDALDAVLRDKLDMPEGDIVRMELDVERMILTVFYDSPEGTKGAGRIGASSEYPERARLKDDKKE